MTEDRADIHTSTLYLDTDFVATHHLSNRNMSKPARQAIRTSLLSSLGTPSISFMLRKLRARSSRGFVRTRKRCCGAHGQVPRLTLKGIVPRGLFLRNALLLRWSPTGDKPQYLINPLWLLTSPLVRTAWRHTTIKTFLRKFFAARSPAIRFMKTGTHWPFWTSCPAHRAIRS
jgi:hypothetical protein